MTKSQQLPSFEALDAATSSSSFDVDKKKQQQQHAKETTSSQPKTPQQQQQSRRWKPRFSTSYHHRYQTIVRKTSNSVTKTFGEPQAWTKTSTAKTMELLKKSLLPSVRALTVTTTTCMMTPTSKEYHHPEKGHKKKSSSSSSFASVPTSLSLVKHVGDEQHPQHPPNPPPPAPPKSKRHGKKQKEHLPPPLTEIYIPTRLNVNDLVLYDNDNDNNNNNNFDGYDDDDELQQEEENEIFWEPKVEQIIDLDDLEYSLSDNDGDEPERPYEEEDITTTVPEPETAPVALKDTSFSSKYTTHSARSSSINSKVSEKEWTKIEQKERNEARFLLLEHAAAAAATARKPYLSRQPPTATTTATSTTAVQLPFTQEPDDVDEPQEPLGEVVIIEAIPDVLEKTPSYRERRRRRRRRHLKKTTSKTKLQSTKAFHHSSSKRSLQSGSGSGSGGRMTPDGSSGGRTTPDGSSSGGSGGRHGNETPSTRTSKSSIGTSSWKTMDLAVMRIVTEDDDDDDDEYERHERIPHQQEYEDYERSQHYHHHHDGDDYEDDDHNVDQSNDHHHRHARSKNTNKHEAPNNTNTTTTNNNSNKERDVSIIYDLALLDHYRREIRRLTKQQNALYRQNAVKSTVQQGKATMQRQWEHKHELRRQDIPMAIQISGGDASVQDDDNDDKDVDHHQDRTLRMKTRVCI